MSWCLSALIRREFLFELLSYCETRGAHTAGAMRDGKLCCREFLVARHFHLYFDKPHIFCSGCIKRYVKNYVPVLVNAIVPAALSILTKRIWTRSRIMNGCRILRTLFSLIGLSLAVSAAQAQGDADRFDYRGDRIEERLDNRGDRIDQRLDNKGDRVDTRLDNRGDRIDARLDRKSDRASDHGKDGLARHLDRKGDRIDTRLDRKGNRVDTRLGKKGDRIDRRLDHKGRRINKRLDRRGNRAANRNRARHGG